MSSILTATCLKIAWDRNLFNDDSWNPSFILDTCFIGDATCIFFETEENVHEIQSINRYSKWKIISPWALLSAYKVMKKDDLTVIIDIKFEDLEMMHFSY